MRTRITLRLVVAIVASIGIAAAVLSQDARNISANTYMILGMPILLRLLFDGIINRMVASLVSAWIPCALFAMIVFRNVEGNEIDAMDVGVAVLAGLAGGLFAVLLEGSMSVLKRQLRKVAPAASPKDPE